LLTAAVSNERVKLHCQLVSVKSQKCRQRHGPFAATFNPDRAVVISGN
jgi:hypothetical protein